MPVPSHLSSRQPSSVFLAIAEILIVCPDLLSNLDGAQSFSPEATAPTGEIFCMRSGRLISTRKVAQSILLAYLAKQSLKTRWNFRTPEFPTTISLQRLYKRWRHRCMWLPTEESLPAAETERRIDFFEKLWNISHESVSETRVRFRLKLQLACLLTRSLEYICPTSTSNKRIRQAASMLRDLLTESPNDAQLIYWYGRCLLHDNRRSDAIIAFQALSHMDNCSSNLTTLLDDLQTIQEHVLLAERASKSLDFDTAALELSSAVDLDKQRWHAGFSAMLFARRAEAMRKTGKLKAASADVDQALALAPRCGLALSVRGILHTCSGRYDLACQDFDQAITADPAIASLQTWRRRAEMWLRQPPSSQNHYVALGLDPDVGIEELRAVFRRAALSSHPDKLKGRDCESMDFDFISIREAFEVLSDPRKRELFDPCWHGQGVWKPISKGLCDRDCAASPGKTSPLSTWQPWQRCAALKLQSRVSNPTQTWSKPAAFAASSFPAYRRWNGLR